VALTVWTPAAFVVVGLAAAGVIRAGSPACRVRSGPERRAPVSERPMGGPA
jgi:hypothetical protein